VLGALLSAVMEVYLRQDLLARFVPKGFAGGVALGLGASLVLPTCECGVVPIVRRLIHKGVPPYVAIVYMLAAPILNPIVLASTFIAFRGDLSLVLGRVVIAVLVAVALGWFVRRKAGPSIKPLPGPDGDQGSFGCNDHIPHEGESLHSCGSSGHDEEAFRSSGSRASHKAKLLQVLVHGAHDFLDMGKYLVLGALAAAFFKTFLPDGVFVFFSSNLLLSISGMMLLAILLSVCSEADAFVAASFVAFPPAARLAFVAIGPMVDLKLIGMYGAAFHRRLFLALLIGPTMIVFAATAAYGLIL
jgi:uncharacterized membrane protein YraQ (UPF0718 family)